VGANIASRARQLTPCLAGILYHHERYDGSGYPKGLKGEDIPLEARILAIADVFAAMTSDRPYSGALAYEEALEEIKRGAGKQFDSHLVEVFLSAIKTAAPVTTTREKVKG
jgi:HD-GYP domain-containing protein (c-di-GMP phosphodiesterase class II)